MREDGAKKKKIRLWAVLFWIMVWQAASMVIPMEIFFVSPWSVLLRLTELVKTAEFWRAVLNTTGRILWGFALALAVGCVLAVLSAARQRVRELLLPLMLVIRTIPVASFIILALICFSSRYLSVLISFLMVVPVVYTNMLEGIGACDVQLREMAQVFCLPAGRQLRYLYLPQVYPYLKSAFSVGMGFAWKSGTAAEVIGMPRGSIGEKLQQAKVYLNTPDLFAWTVAIVVMSLFLEKAGTALLELAYGRLQRMSEKGGKHV